MKGILQQSDLSTNKRKPSVMKNVVSQKTEEINQRNKPIDQAVII